MAENIIIRTDGEEHTYNNVKKIRTSNVSGEDTTWIPLADTEQAVNTIVKNGTYKASDDGYYGYSKVIVNAGGKVVGTKSDGKKYKVTVNSSGELEYVEMPVKIKITTKPSKMSYVVDESIDLSGAVIKAFKKDDTPWNVSGYPNGVIPHNEITLTPKKASEIGTQVITLSWLCPDDEVTHNAMMNITVGAE